MKPGMSFEEQITGPVVDYLKDRFAKVGRSTQGASLSDLYRTVNGGNPNAPLTASDGNGTIAQHIEKIAMQHGRKAEEWLGGNVDIQRAVRDGTVEGNEQSRQAVENTEATRPEVDTAKANLDAARKAAEEARSQIQPSVGVNTDVSGLLEQNRQLAETKKEILRLDQDVSAQEARQRFNKAQLEDLHRTKQIILETKQPILDIIEQQRVAAEMRQREKELLAEGMLPAAVAETLEIEKQVNLALQKNELQTAILEGRIAELTSQENQTEAVKAEVKLLREKVTLLKAARGEIEAAGSAAKGNINQQNSPNARLDQAITDSKKKLAELQDPINLVVGGANAIGDAFGEAFKNIVSGSMSAQEAFAQMTQKIANYFLEMAASMIAEYVKIILMQTILNAIGGPSLGGNSAQAPKSNALKAGWPGNQNYAQGGRPAAGEPIIVGERGPEIFTPDSAGTISSNRFFDASRDSMSMDADAQSANFEQQQTSDFYEAMSNPENREFKVSYDSTVINEVEYVTADQFQRGMKDTADRARAQTIKDLRNYPGKRAAVGMR